MAHVTDMPMEKYIELPAVSTSVIRRIVTECPMAGWYDSHLNPARVDETTDAMDRGTIAHSILLEGHAGKIAVIDPNDHPAEKTGNIPDGWTNKSIRLARDVARAERKIPVLTSDMAEIRLMVESAQRFIETLRHTEPKVWEMFQRGAGDSEMTITWLHDGTPCKIRPDRISADRTLIADAKFTDTSAEPNKWARTQMVGMGNYMSAAFYREGVRREFGRQADYVFLVCEAKAPYLCSLVGVDPAGYELGWDKCTVGLDIWADCVKEKTWPAYPNRICYSVMPAWELDQWEGKKYLYDQMHGGSHGV